MPNNLETMAEMVGQFPPVDEEGESLSAVCTKWVLVSEWMGSDGERWLIRRFATGHGEGVAIWDAKGMLHEALYGDSW